MTTWSQLTKKIFMFNSTSKFFSWSYLILTMLTILVVFA